MTLELEKRPLGAVGMHYVRDRLRAGKSFSKAILANRNLDAGTVSAILPASVSREASTRFRIGGILAREQEQPLKHITNQTGQALRSEPIGNARPWLVELISTFLDDEGRACLVENALARLGDPWLARSRSRIAYFGDEVFHILLSHDSRRDIEDAVREAHSIWPPSIGGLICIPSDITDVPSILTLDLINKLALSAVAVFVGAYDGESYLLWES